MQATQSSKASGTEYGTETFGLILRADREGDPALGRRSVAENLGLAHDAGNLLGALRLYSELLAVPGTLREEHRGYAAELRLLSEQSTAMIERLLRHSGESGPAVEQGDGTVLAEVVERCRGLLARVAGREIVVEREAGGDVAVPVSCGVAERILTNLVKNAAESMRGEGVVRVSVRGGLGGVELVVLDSGCGMSGRRARMLERGDGVGRVRGRGLGLRVVWELVAQSGGWLRIASELGVGTSVMVGWPVIGVRPC